MVKKSFYLLVFFFCFHFFCFSQQINPLQIIDDLYYQQTKGPIKDIQGNFTISGPLKGAGGTVNINVFAKGKIFFRLPNRFRIEQTEMIPDVPTEFYVIKIKDGTYVWYYNEYASMPFRKEIDSHQHSIMLPYGIEIQPQDRYLKYTYIGEETVEDADCFVIGVVNTQDPDLILTTIWVDKQLKVPRQLTTKRVIEKKKEKGTVEIKKVFQKINQLEDGRWFPEEITIYEDGELSLIIKYTSLSINQGLSDDLFEGEVKLPDEFMGE